MGWKYCLTVSSLMLSPWCAAQSLHLSPIADAHRTKVSTNRVLLAPTVDLADFATTTTTPVKPAQSKPQVKIEPHTSSKPAVSTAQEDYATHDQVATELNESASDIFLWQQSKHDQIAPPQPAYVNSVGYQLLDSLKPQWQNWHSGLRLTAQFELADWQSMTGELEYEMPTASGISFEERTHSNPLAKTAKLYKPTRWNGYRLQPSMSLAPRLSMQPIDPVLGSSNGSHFASAVTPYSYGGDLVDFGIGVNIVGREGLWQGHRLAIEFVTPVYEDCNGLQPDFDQMITAGYNLAL